MNERMLTLLKVLIVVLLGGGVLAQVFFIPLLASSEAEVFPEVDYLAIPYAVLAI